MTGRRQLRCLMTLNLSERIASVCLLTYLLMHDEMH